MDYLNLHQLQTLCSSFTHKELTTALLEGQYRQGIHIWTGYDEEPLLEQAQKLSWRECCKLNFSKTEKEEQGPERWMFGEFKIFAAVALLLAHTKKITLELLVLLPPCRNKRT
jgi:hypothetical protein